MEGLTAWLRREHPGGMREPLSWLDQFLKKMDGSGLITEPQKIGFLEALQGDLRGEQVFRLREGSRQLTPNVEWRWIWGRDLFGMKLMNELQSATIDGQPLSLPGSYADWDSDRLSHPLQLPLLPAGKHTLRLSVLSALVFTTDLVGLKSNAPSADWPAARKRWTRSSEIEITVFPEGAEILSAVHDPSLNPATHGLSIEPLIIRRAGSGRNATLKFDLDKSLPVPIGFDVSLRVGDQTIPCGSVWAVTTKERSSQGNNVLSADIAPIDAEVRVADVVLIPNAKLIELQPGIDRFWGDEIVFRNVALRRLDATEQ